MDSASDSSGFSSHVLNQFHEMSQQVTNRGRGFHGRGRGQGQAPPRWSQQQQSLHPQQQSTPFTITTDSFPPLGSKPQPAPSTVASFQPGPQYQSEAQRQPQGQPSTFNDVRHGTPREYQERARGNHRGGRHFYGQQHRPQQTSQQSSQPLDQAQSHDYARPPPRQTQLYNPNAGMHYGTIQQQRDMRHLIMRQSDYLAGIGRRAYDEYKFTQEEKDVKEAFRLSLEEIAKKALGAKYPDLQIDQVKLKCYGSLANGFALKNCDMDLLLCLPGYGEPDTKQPEPTITPDGEHVATPDDGVKESGFKSDVQRILEKAFLDHEYGARLLTQTRVPILRICQRPTPALLANLRDKRARWENSVDHTSAAQEVFKDSEVPTEELDALEQAVTDLNLTKTKPNQGSRGNVCLDFTDDCGIQSDINFSNFVAIYNSTLLRFYHSFDPRVKEVGGFVKIWAKTRDINTPYRGTLSSYGWILMVLHYLMNIAQPPVIPNLQYLAKTEDSWDPDRQIELFEGFDVRFVQDQQSLQDILSDMAANRNRESSGQLLRGFFQYYGTNQGFHWTRDIITIRTKGGIMSKQVKGWTEAKWQQGESKTVRNRYLFAIEDPFEIEHNIARTIGHHGIVTIRNEFRRAWGIIEKIGTDEEIPAEEFLNPITDRVDTHKKDQDAYRQRQMQMRQEAEAREKAMLQQAEAEKNELQTDGTWGDPRQGKAQTYSSPHNDREVSESKLTTTPPTQDRKQSKMPSRRRMKVDSDDEEDLISTTGQERQEDAAIVPQANDSPRKRKEGLTSRAEVLYANGFDLQGNPVPWDISTQEGRWLHWRDSKTRKGTLGEFHNESLRELDEQCPYDSRRPSPYAGKSYWRRNHQELVHEKPPWPANNPKRDNTIRTDPGQDNPSEPKHAVSSTADNSTLGNGPQLPKVEEMPTTKVSDQSSNDGGSKPTVGTDQAGKIESHNDASTVGTNIPWDRSTTGGNWLWQRDKRIIKGTWQEQKYSTHKNWYRKLHTAFPYNPKMTWAELEEKNEQLRRYHMRTIYAMELQPPSSEHNPTSFSIDRLDEPTSSSGVVRRVVAGTSEPPSHDVVTEEIDMATQLNSTGVRSSTSAMTQLPDAVPWSDGHPSQYTVSDEAPTTPPNNDRAPDVDFLRIRRLAFFTKNTAPSKSEIDTNDQFFIEAAVGDGVKWATGESQTPIASRIDLALHHHEDNRGEEKAKNPIPESANNFSELSVEVSDSPITDDFNLKVPATLYPGVDKDKRPTDEDPNIMPIPRSIGFQFDPRQLQDLAVISKGGNGCAREGAEFNVEDDVYEWGGGGMMGYRTNTSPQAAGISSHPTPYEAGKGDEEGFLDELPRNWDGCTTTDC